MYRSLAAQGSIPKSYSAKVNLPCRYTIYCYRAFDFHGYSATSPILWVSTVEMVLLPKVLKVKYKP